MRQHRDDPAMEHTDIRPPALPKESEVGKEVLAKILIPALTKVYILPSFNKSTLTMITRLAIKASNLILAVHKLCKGL